jgi:hypothetical protein
MKCSHNPALRAARIASLCAAGFSAAVFLPPIAPAAGSSTAGAKDAGTRFSVTATVRAIARIENQTVPADLWISAADLRRGFIVVAQPTTLVVRSNSADGFTLDVLSVVPLLSSITVRGLTGDQSLGGDGGTLVERWQAPQALTLSLHFRLGLAPGLTPGRYPWPLRLAVRPLESA